MATIRLKNLQEVTDFVRGCTFYATGGGGLLLCRYIWKLLEWIKNVDWTCWYGDSQCNWTWISKF